MTKKTALITGGTGGLGLITARTLVANGWQVYAADCNQSALDSLNNEAGITPLFMDVTDRASIEKAFSEITSQHDFLDAVVNFAGILRIGSIAEMDEATLALLLNINVMGTYRVNQVFLPLLNTEKKKGRIINISSETGWQSGAPFNGAYAMSKHAIEAYSDSLRRELMLLGIAVIKVQPGPFKTEMVAAIETNFTRAIETSTLFKKTLTTVRRHAVKEQDRAHSPQILADAILKALSAQKPKAAYSVNADKARSFLEYLPTCIADKLIAMVIK